MARSFSLRSYVFHRLLWLLMPVQVMGVAIHWHLESGLIRREFDRGLVEKATTLATLVTERGSELELNFADEFMPYFSPAESPYYFQVWYPDGRLLERSRSLEGQDLPFALESLEAASGAGITLPDGEKVRCVSILFPVRQGSDPEPHPLGRVAIAVGASADQLRGDLRVGMQEVAVAGTISVLCTFLAVLLSLKHGVRLLENVAQEVVSISPSSPTPAFDVDRVPDEIRPIVASLNRSMLTIRAIVERERRFNSDVAHELRTPIAELRTAADVALHWPDSETSRRLAVRAQEISVQMSRLVESLLELANLDSMDQGPPEEAFDLARLVTLQVEDFLRQRPERRISVDVEEELFLSSRPALWEVIVRNLIDNALSHSGSDDVPALELGRDGAGARLCISNAAPDLSAETVELCRNRLWRARPREECRDHAGLGLSIVEAAAARIGHHLEVRLEGGLFQATISRSGSGLRNATDGAAVEARRLHT